MNVTDLARITRTPHFDDNVRRLMHAAWETEDMVLCSTCDLALLGDHAARLEVAKLMVDAGGAT